MKTEIKGNKKIQDMKKWNKGEKYEMKDLKYD